VRYTAFTASRSNGTAFGIALWNVTGFCHHGKRECYHDVMEKGWHLGGPLSGFYCLGGISARGDFACMPCETIAKRERFLKKRMARRG
jgi:hypothetical protein